MTALPIMDRESLSLVCDDCGHRLSGSSSTLRNWDVAWAPINKHGWTGSPLAIGPHRCPQCADAATRTVADGAETAPPTAASPWRASTRTVGAIAVVELHGDLDLLIADELRTILAEACAGHRDVVLDLAGVRLVDPTALGILVRAHQTAKAKGGHLCLATPSRFILAALQTLRLQPVFPVFANRDQAVEWITAGWM